MFSIYRMFHWTNPMVGESMRIQLLQQRALWPCGPVPFCTSDTLPWLATIGPFLARICNFPCASSSPLDTEILLESSQEKAALDSEMTAMNHATQICSKGTSVSPNLLIGSGRNLKGIPATASHFSGWAWVC